MAAEWHVPDRGAETRSPICLCGGGSDTIFVVIFKRIFLDADVDFPFVYFIFIVIDVFFFFLLGSGSRKYLQILRHLTVHYLYYI